MTPRDDERRKALTVTSKIAEENGSRWIQCETATIRKLLVRAEQAETPLNGPSCTVCGTAMEFKCPSCGSTPAPTEPSQSRPVCTCGDIYSGFPDGEPTAEQFDSTCPIDGVTGVFRAAAAPVEDRPAPKNQRRWMILPKNSAYPNFNEVHREDDWCPKAGCVPVSDACVVAGKTEAPEKE